jgi:hypothetical protein
MQGYHMKLDLKTFLVFAVAAISVETFALPPPPPINVVVLSRDPDARALLLAYLTYLEEKGEFRWETNHLKAADFGDCVANETYDSACVKRVLKHAQFTGAGVAIMVDGPAGLQRWRCAGRGVDWRSEAKQQINVDLRAALFAKGGERLAANNAAYGCLISAAAEIGW